MSLKSSPKNSILPSLLERVAATSVWNTLPCSYVIKHCCSGFQENQIKLCDSWMNLSALFLLIAFLFLPLHLSFRSDIAYINCSTFETTSLKANLLCACMCVCVRMCMCGCVHVCVCMRTCAHLCLKQLTLEGYSACQGRVVGCPASPPRCSPLTTRQLNTVKEPKCQHHKQVTQAQFKHVSKEDISVTIAEVMLIAILITVMSPALTSIHTITDNRQPGSFWCFVFKLNQKT